MEVMGYNFHIFFSNFWAQICQWWSYSSLGLCLEPESTYMLNYNFILQWSSNCSNGVDDWAIFLYFECCKIFHVMYGCSNHHIVMNNLKWFEFILINYLILRVNCKFNSLSLGSFWVCLLMLKTFDLNF